MDVGTVQQVARSPHGQRLVRVHRRARRGLAGPGIGGGGVAHDGPRRQRGRQPPQARRRRGLGHRRHRSLRRGPGRYVQVRAAECEGGYFQGGWRACHNVYPQMSGRPAAAAYLKRIALCFDGETRKHLLAAAGKYEQATEAWRAFSGQLGRDAQHVANVEHGAAWTSEKHRKAGAAAVARAARHERAAVAALAEALEAIEGS